MSLLDIVSLTHRFGGLTAVNDFNEKLGYKETVGLIGPNGAGKTTVFNLVSGFYVPSQGDILLEEHRINGLKPHKVASRKVSRTFQNIRLWPDMSVLDNLMIANHDALEYTWPEVFFRSSRYKDAEKALREESMEHLRAFSLEKFAAERPKNLPYGVQRKVELARALSIGPKLLMLDEPAAGLNSADVKDLIGLVEWIRENFEVTIWMIEHQMDVVMSLCDRIKVIDFGSVIAEGGPAEIQNSPVVIKAYLGDGAI
jgi:branched-chain amino acid transport system ATP-binding protein